ncbi:hypothetical protein [Bacillus infantis]|uniref:hypothetical protein n=1 Tax=Bacillus infantis TaxID=324767 RepID=UPI003CE7D5F9
MIANELDKQINDLLLDTEAKAGQTLERFRGLLENLCEELKQVWHKKGFTDSLAKNLINDCLNFATSPLGDCGWDEMKADELKTLFVLADQAKELREAVGWADRSRDVEARLLFKKLESEKHMIFINDSLEHLEGMAYRLLTWLNARSSLIQAYRNR